MKYLASKYLSVTPEHSEFGLFLNIHSCGSVVMSLFHPNCLICDLSVENSEIVTVGEKGLAGLVKASHERGDNHWKFLAGVQSIVLHKECRRVYTHPSSISRDNRLKLASSFPSTSLQTTPTKKKLRNLEDDFDFRSCCLFCAEEIDFIGEKKKEVRYRRTICRVETLNFCPNIQSIARKRGDVLGRVVLRRLSNVIDLVAAEGVYHKDCHAQFLNPRPKQSLKRGRPESENVTAAMEEIFKILDESDECQFSLSELTENLIFVPDTKTIKRKLMEKYGDSILVTSQKNNETVVCFRRTGEKILSSAWYTQKKASEYEERLRIVRTAAAIILEDVKSLVFDQDAYPAPQKFLSNVQTEVPESLEVFLDDLIVKSRKKVDNVRPLLKKRTAVAHVIMSCIRPRSFHSTLLVSIGLYLHQHFGSKNLVNFLASMNFCASYHEIQLFESSAATHPQPGASPLSFIQYVFDNADHNVDTLDGKNTFHCLGGIKCLTPARSLIPSESVPRLKKAPPADVIGHFNEIPLKKCTQNARKGLYMKFMPLKENSDLLQCDVGSFAWLMSKFLNIDGISSWNGFMEISTRHEKYEQSRIIFLPFIRAPPSNYDTIYSALLFASQDADSIGREVIIVTFDLPLYLKAREIVQTLPQEMSSRYFIRLGGFHLLMSFLGSIGYIMDGSGIKELLTTIFAPNSIDKMLTGHAFSRSIRGHFLIHESMAKILLNDMELSENECEEMKELLNSEEFTWPFDSELLKEFMHRFEIHLQEVEARGPTAKLWVQYFRTVSLVKKFVAAERMGNWALHLECVQEMLKFFHAAGHFQYAKAAHLYLQDSLNLQEKMCDFEYDEFLKYFTIRRSENYFAGVWSDMTIEQTMMRLMKSRGGLTRGRGVQPSVIQKWILSMPTVMAICEEIEEYTGCKKGSSEQHVDLRPSRMLRDTADVEKLTQWFLIHNPFPESPKIASLSTGVIGDASINCHESESIGNLGIQSMIGKTFSDVKLKRGNRVKPLGSINCSIRTGGSDTPIDPLLLFQRISFLKRTDEELKTCFSYELAPFPTSLFTEGGIRKTQKSALYSLCTEEQFPICSPGDSISYVVDGGFLLHRKLWASNLGVETFGEICARFESYLRNIGSDITVVFDGYENATKNIKNAEQLRRSGKLSSRDYVFDWETPVPVAQEAFLSNVTNKMNLIKMLEQYLSQHFDVRVATDDADSIIVNTAFRICRLMRRYVVIIGEDTDLAVLLAGLGDKYTRGRTFYRVNQRKGPAKTYSAAALRKYFSKFSLALHAISGCDTTSSFFGKGKKKLFTTLRKKVPQALLRVMYNSKATADDIATAGEQIIRAIYGATSTTSVSLNDFRFECFQKGVRKKKFNLCSIPPTSAAARQHFLRAFYQVQTWLGVLLDPEEWGWRRTENGLKPIPTMDAAAPENILKIIFCSCRKDICGKRCGCRRMGLTCSGACLCSNCTNHEVELDFDGPE